jgi:hypothetical protein
MSFPLRKSCLLGRRPPLSAGCNAMRDLRSFPAVLPVEHELLNAHCGLRIAVFSQDTVSAVCYHIWQHDGRKRSTGIDIAVSSYTSVPVAAVF